MKKIIIILSPPAEQKLNSIMKKIGVNSYKDLLVKAVNNLKVKSELRKSFFKLTPDEIKLEEEKSKFRNIVGIVIVILYAGFIVGTVVKGLILADSMEKIIKIITTVGSIISAPIGAVIGFYYGKKKE